MNHSPDAMPDANAPVHTCLPVGEREIRELAAKIWTEAGRPDGRDTQISLEAEAKLRAGQITEVQFAEFECAVYPALW